MALSLLRCQRLLHRALPVQQQRDLAHQFISVSKRNHSGSTWKVIPQRPKLLSVASTQAPASRHISFGRVEISRGTGLFVIAFGSMTALMVGDTLYDKYRRSGFSFSDLWSGQSQEESLFEKDFDSGKLSTKYAAILSANETPQLKVSRSVPGTVKLPNMKLTLLQYQTCPFCCKVRSFLDYYGLPYDVIEVNPVMRQQLKFSKKYRKVPILLITSNNANEPENQDSSPTESETLQINDSTLIISTLTSYLLSQRPKSKHQNETLTTLTRWYLNNKTFLNEEEEKVSSDAVFQAKNVADELVNRYFLMIGDVDPTKYDRMDPPLAEERRWRRWADDHFVHVLSPNIYRTYDEALKSFNYFSQVGEWEKNFANWERTMVINVGALAMYFVSKRLKKKYVLKDDVRLSLYDSCNHWLKGIGPNRRFMGGDLPNLADLAVYGSLSSIEGCDAFGDVMQNTKISRWYFDVKAMVEQHEGSQKIKLPF